MAFKVHITGAACAGTTTLGRRLARALGVSHLDTDDYYWLPTEVPYTQKRPVPERLRLMEQGKSRGGWVVSGSVMGWGERLMQDADLVVFVYTRPDVRLKRLKAREGRRYGARIRAGGDMFHIHQSFVDWAMSYDDPHHLGRSLASHQAWLAHMDLPVLRLDGTRSTGHLCRQVMQSLVPHLAFPQTEFPQTVRQPSLAFG